MRIQATLLMQMVWLLTPRCADAAETVRLSLIVTTTFGVPIENAQSNVISIGPAETFTGPSNSSGEVSVTVPIGQYDIEVNSPGFLTHRERIGAYQASLVCRIGLALAPQHGEKRPELRGTVSPFIAKSADYWVRLVSLYGGGLVEDSVDDMGKFALTGFAPGKYLLLLLDKDSVVSMREVEVYAGVKTVNLSTNDHRK